MSSSAEGDDIASEGGGDRLNQGDGASAASDADSPAVASTAHERLDTREPPPFEAPVGFRKAEYAADAASDFDLDAVLADDDTELWLIRAPSGIGVKHLEDTPVPLAGASTTFRARKTTYAIADALSHADMDSMSVYLPQQSSGHRLYRASKPFKRKLAITLVDTHVDAVDTVEEAPLSTREQHRQPKLRYRHHAFAGAPHSERQRPHKRRKKV